MDRIKPQSGSILISLIITLPFIILIIGSYTQLSVNDFILGRLDQFRSMSQLAADAGADKAIEQINLDENWAGTGGEITLQDNPTAKTTYEVTITDVAEDEKNVTSIGRSYKNSSDSTPETTVKISMSLNEIESQSFSIVTGVGGLKLSNSAKVLGGDVFVNGSVTMSNTAQIGLAQSPVNLSVAHQNCPNPPDSSYPQLCASGENGQPITLYNNAHIYGDVRANNQTDGSGMSDGGLVASSGVATKPLPPHDRAGQISAVTQTVDASSVSCQSNKDIVTWNANLKINGTPNLWGKCTIIVKGDVWITGNFHPSNQVEIKVDDSLGTTRPNIMVDSTVTFSNSSSIVSNTDNTGAQVITYKSNASCSPDCSDVTGVDLYNSQNLATIHIDNSFSAPQSIFYAKWSLVRVSNSGQIGALVGQTVEMNNTGTITFGTSVGDSTSFWILNGYRRVY